MRWCGRRRFGTTGLSRWRPASLRRRLVLAARSSACATGLKPTSPRATSVVCSNPEILVLKPRTKDSVRGRPRAFLPALKPAGDGRRMVSRSDGCAATTRHARRIRTSQTKTARMHGQRPTSRRASSPGSPGSCDRFPNPRPISISHRPSAMTVGSLCRPLSKPLSRLSDIPRHGRAPSTIGRHRRSSTTSRSCAHSARSRARCPGRCASSANVCSRCTSRPNVHVPATSTPARWRTLDTPDVRTSSSPASRKDECFRRRPRTPSCSIRSARRSRLSCGFRQTGLTKPCTPRWGASPCPARRALHSVTRLRIRASSARRMRPG